MKPSIVRNLNKNVVQITNSNGKAITVIKATKRKQNDAPNCQEISHPKRKCSDKKCKNIIEAADDIFLEEEEDGFVEIGDRSAPRKSLDPSKWKRNLQQQAKRLQYEKKSSASVPTCKHKSGPYKCKEVRSKDVAFIRKIFSKHTKTVDQNRYILSQVVVDSVKRHRPRNNLRSKKNVAPSFFLRLMSAKRIRVCKVAFGIVLGVGRGRLTKLIAHYNKFGEAKDEGRGGDHKLEKFGWKRDSVVNFIKKLKARESHYGRNKSRRLYLPHELKSIKNLCQMYNSNQEPAGRVKYGFFKAIFRKRFNLAFGTPRTDVCSFCLRHKHLLSTEKDPIKKQLIRGRLRLHKLRSKAFYKLLKERKAHIKTFAGDCQQNQAMPKIPDQASYFSRQLNLYNFTIAENIGEEQTLNCAYTWTEDQSKKGSNEIASAACHKLMNTDFDGIELVRMFADGCGGQNKNVQMLCMASWWLVNKAPKSVEAMQLVFPVTGHSYLPPDRVFGRIEKDIRKEEEILAPSQYHEIMQKHETVRQLGRDWKVFDWKKYAGERFKSAASLPFKISQTKIFEIRKSKVPKTAEIKAEKYYRNSSSKFEAVCKKGTLCDVNVCFTFTSFNKTHHLLRYEFGIVT